MDMPTHIIATESGEINNCNKISYRRVKGDNG